MLIVLLSANFICVKVMFCCGAYMFVPLFRYDLRFGLFCLVLFAFLLGVWLV